MLFFDSKTDGNFIQTFYASNFQLMKILKDSLWHVCDHLKKSFFFFFFFFFFIVDKIFPKFK